MNAYKPITTLFSFVLLSACGADSENLTPQSQSNADKGTFQIEVEGLVQFDHTATKAKSFIYRNDFLEFTAKGVKFRMAGRFAEDSPGVEQASIDLEHNNVYLEFSYKVGKKNTRVSCKAAQQPKGRIKRTIHSDLSSSGSFNIELVLCRNTYTSEKITTITTPVMVKGQFKNVPNQESLF